MLKISVHELLLNQYKQHVNIRILCYY